MTENKQEIWIDNDDSPTFMIEKLNQLLNPKGFKLTTLPNNVTPDGCVRVKMEQIDKVDYYEQ